MFQTDICLVLDQMIEGGKRAKTWPGKQRVDGWEIQNMENAARAT